MEVEVDDANIKRLSELLPVVFKNSKDISEFIDVALTVLISRLTRDKEDAVARNKAYPIA